jgi:integrase
LPIGIILVDRDDRIAFVSDSVRDAIGEVVGVYGWTMVTLAGKPCTRECALALHLSVRDIGEVRITSGFVLTGPLGSIYITQARIGVWPIDNDKLVNRMVFVRLTSGAICGIFSSSSGDETMTNLALVQRGSDAIKLADALHDYVADMVAADNGDAYSKNTRLSIERACRAMKWVDVTDLTESSVREYLMSCKAKGLAAQTLRLYWDDLARFAEWCLKRGMFPRRPDGTVASNPVRLVKKARKSRTRARLVPTDDEVRKLVESLRHRKQAKDRWAVYACASNQPLRWKVWKLLRPEWVHLDDPRPHIRVPGEFKEPGSKRSVIVMKNRKERVEYLTPETVAILRMHKADFGWGRRVFQSVPKCEMFTRDVVRARIRQRDDHGATFSFHSLKHYASNRRMRLGWSIEERRHANDHSTAGMTLDVYTDPDLIRVAEKTASMPGIFGAQIIDGTGVTKNLSESDPKGLTRTGVIDDNLDVQETLDHTMQATTTTTCDHGETAGLMPGGPSPEQSGLQGSPAALRDRGHQHVAQLGSATGLGPVGRQFKSDRADHSNGVSGAPADVAVATGSVVRIHERPSGASSGISSNQDQDHEGETTAGCFDVRQLRDGVCSQGERGTEWRSFVLLPSVFPRQYEGQDQDGLRDSGVNAEGPNQGAGACELSGQTGPAGPQVPVRGMWRCGEDGRAPRGLHEAGHGGMAVPEVSHEAPLAEEVSVTPRQGCGTNHHDGNVAVYPSPHLRGSGEGFGSDSMSSHGGERHRMVAQYPPDQCSVQTTQAATTGAVRAHGAGSQPGHWSSQSPGVRGVQGDPAPNVAHSPKSESHARSAPVFGADSLSPTPGDHDNDTPVAGRFTDTHADAIAECAGAIRRTHKGSPRMVALLSLATALSALAHVQDVTRGYATGKECYWGSPAHLMPTVAQCIDACAAACPQLLADCAIGCAGGYPPNEYVEAMRQARKSIDAGENIDKAVLVIEAGMYHPDETVRIVATALGSETPFVHVH